MIPDVSSLAQVQVQKLSLSMPCSQSGSCENVLGTSCSPYPIASIGTGKCTYMNGDVYGKCREDIPYMDPMAI